MSQPATPADRMRARWLGMDDRTRIELLELVRDRFAILGPVRVDLVGQPLTNTTGLELADTCVASHPRDWSYAQLVFATALWVTSVGGIGFTELNQADLTLSLLAEFLEAKRDAYLRRLGHTGDATPDLVELARSVAALREELERDHLRCYVIDGGSWERREHFLALSAVEPDAIPGGFAGWLYESLGVRLPDGGDHRERFGGLVERLAHAGVNPADALAATADYVARDGELDADYAVLSAARGVNLDAPWTLELSDIFSYVAIREGYDCVQRGVRLSHDQVRTAIQQRMRYNATRRALNYSPDRDERLKAQPFQFPDLATMEDAHHGGHRATGIRSVARAPFPIDVPGGRQWRGLADLRINRASYADEDRYGFDELTRLVRYGMWCRAIVEAAYTRGLVLDAAYGAKQLVAPRAGAPRGTRIEQVAAGV